MKIINRTHWRTSDLRRIIYRAGKSRLDKQPARHLTRGWAQNVKVYVTYGHRGCDVGGLAYLHGGPVYLYVGSDAVSPILLARTTMHEFDHARGLRHRDMLDLGDYRVAWAQGLPIRKVEVKLAPSRTERAALRRDTRLRNAEAKVAEWARKTRLATTKLNRWRKRAKELRRLERAAALKGGE